MVSDNDDVLVAILNNLRDFAIACDAHWYRIPISSFDRWLKRGWPPQWLAFYQTKIFGNEGYAINYYAQVLDVHQRYRHELFPDEIPNEKTNRRYYQLIIGPLLRRDPPIFSRQLRRIVFITTTWQKFSTALEINDLYAGSPLEDQVWAALKRFQIAAERQYPVKVRNRFFILDFAIFCSSGKLNVETDGDTWHHTPERAPQDNVRDNALKTKGWRILRFNTKQINQELENYCLPTIVENINNLGGLDEGRIIPRPISLDPYNPRQLSLFDD
jgi:very-short-patch-repair endonuclease